MAQERHWIGGGHGWNEHARAATDHRCTCGQPLTRVGPITQAGTALLECAPCRTTHHLIGASR